MSAIKNRTILSRCHDVHTAMEATPEEDCLVIDARAYHIPDLPQHCADLYEADGQRAPLILDRPAALSLDLIPGILFEAGGTVIEACIPSGNRQYTPAAIRKFAASLAVLADEAEADAPDPAEVSEIAEKISAAIASRGQGIYGVYRVAAEVAIRHFRDQQRGEQP
jgi:hypothetical protein